MKKEFVHTKRLFLVAAISCLIAILSGVSAYAFFAYERLIAEKNALEQHIVALERIEEATTNSLMNERAVNQNLAEANQNLGQSLQSEQDKNQQFSSQIEQISGTVGKLEKLSKTPPELLKKYSKVYFLNENYVPTPLEPIDSKYLFEKGRPQQVLGPVKSFLARMLDAAKADGKELLIVSAYRSFADQMAVKSGYKVLYGSGANQFSADQGYSEHQLGTAVDLTAPALDGLSSKFDASPSYKWLTDNAYRFGYILSYPKGNAYYQYEPWHWRFVGVALATRIHDYNARFYELLQSDIDTYLINIFD